MLNLVHYGMKGWLYMTDKDRRLIELVRDGLELPHHIAAAARLITPDFSPTLDEIGRSGWVRRSGERPWRVERGRRLTDAEWTLIALDTASYEFRRAAADSGWMQAEWESLMDAALMIEERADELREIVEI